MNAPLSEPVFSMSTTPPSPGPPGRRFEAVMIATPSLELSIDSVPEENVFEGFAEEAVKSAPEPTTAPAASSRVSSAPRASRGWETSTWMRDIGGSFG